MRGALIAAPRRERADRLLVAQGLAESRERAQALILAGVVFLEARRIDKPGAQLPAEARLRVAADPLPYVGRGGLKLAAALEHFRIDPSGWTALDVGCSTGGFTDCLLQAGARRVLALDVGRGQIHWRLRQDPRVHLFEGINARLLRPGDLPLPIDLTVVDVSFISLRLVVPPVRRAAAPGEWVLLVKPQFEVGRGEVGKGGVVRDPDKRLAAVEKIAAFARSQGLTVHGVTESPIHGPAGNVEYLMHLETA